jgi:hypothetical protein
MSPSTLTTAHILLLNNQLLQRQHRLRAFVLPAAHWTTHAAGTGRAFLCSRPTDVCFFCRRHWLSRCRTLNCRRALYHKWRWVTSESTPDHHAQKDKHDNDPGALQPERLRETWATLVTEPPAGPDTPAQAHDFRTAFRTKIWMIIREERQSSRIIDNSREKQPIREQMRPKSARLKNFGRAGILCRPIFLCVTQNPFFKHFF